MATKGHTPKLSAERAQRRQLVLQYTLAGASTRDIAHTLTEQGYSVTHTTIANDRKAVLRQMTIENQEGAEAMRDLYNARYERLIASRWSAALSGDNDAYDRVLKAMEGQRKINGIDQTPPKITLDQSSTTIGVSIAAPSPEEWVVIAQHLAEADTGMVVEGNVITST